MSTVTACTHRQSDDGFRHEALFYAEQQAFLDGTVPFIRDGLAAQEPVLVIVSAAKIDLLRAELDGDADDVHFGDMAEVGGNPARIIPAWRRFLRDRSLPGAPLRGIGEPIWAERSPAELVECQRHESLLNLAFAGSALRLLCPYDTCALDPAVLAEARRSHPYLVEDGAERDSGDYRGLEAVAAPFDEPLPEPPAQHHELPFQAGTLATLRRFVSRHADDAGLTEPRSHDLVLAVDELATNSVRHGGGRGILRIWTEPGALVCEVHDCGRIEEPLVGRELPTDTQVGGHGLWIVNQVCDLVQIRSFATGGVVRLHMRLH